MVGSVVETYSEGETWRNRVGWSEPLPGEFRTREAAAELGRDEARIRGVEHVIRRADGSVAERHRYPRRADEIPG
jgi:hypothetical protein